MLKLAADENFHGRVLRGILRHQPDLDIVRIQDTGVYQADDPAVLAWAAAEGRVLLTHDVHTMPHFASERIAAGLLMPGVFLIDQRAPMGQIIEDVILLALASHEGEWEGQILFIPLK